MKKNASCKKRILLLAAVLICSLSTGYAASYKLGDEADEIATIQGALKTLGLYQYDTTGHYGAKTEAAVKLFQKKYALTSDGIAGDDTIAALYKAAGIAGASSGSSASSAGSSILRYDSSGSAVTQLQKDLAALGYYKGTVSGHFGTKTEAAVMAFQKANGLTADGQAGSKTLAKIASALNGSSSSGSAASSSSPASSGGALKYGMKNSGEVKTLQQNLKTLGYYTGSVTGNYGNLTKDAVYSYQKARGLSADGVAGAKTLAQISADITKGVTSSSASSSSTVSSSGSSSTMQVGSNSGDVKQLQTMLSKLGYYSGSITGNFGTITRDSVIAYQKAKKLTADGVVGSKTLAAITADYNKKIGGSSSSGSAVASGVSASKVLYQNFFNWRRNYANGQNCTVYDPATGYSWTLRIMTKDKHMDAEPLTAEDTATMNKAFGNKTTWTPKVVYVTFSDGKTYIGSTHNTPHETYHIGTNNFAGHLCVHFPIPMETAKSIGSYATSHQEAINAGWNAIQGSQY